MDIRSFVVDVIKKINHDKIVVDYDAELLESEILDSLGVVTLLGDLKEKYNIEVDVEDVLPENFSTINTIIAMLEKYLKK